MKFTLGKQERLKSKKLIEAIYEEGDSVKVFPLRMVYMQKTHTSDFPAQIGVSVPKRNFKLAVDRNRIKRLLREAYRKQKHIVYDNIDTQFVYMISYIGKEIPTYEVVEKKMNKLLTSFIDEIKSEENHEK